MGDEADAIVDRLSNPDPFEGVWVGQLRCRHELIQDQCGLCTPRTRPAPSTSDPFESVPERGLWFRASYSGECATCGEDIEPGDEIRAVGDNGYEGRMCCE